MLGSNATRLKLSLIFILCGVLLGAILMQTRNIFGSKISVPKVDLRAVIAVDVPGWYVRDLPIGETEEIKTAAVKTLRFDDYIFRSYRKEGVEFTIYVAYWGPGKHPPQMITQHTPDRCWPMNGMTCEEMRFNVPVKLGGKSLWPAQWRKFRAPNGVITYTMFWHMVGNRPYNFGERFYDVPNPITFWSEAALFAAGARPAQLFFRITSNQPPEHIWPDSGFQKAIQGFIILGLEKHGS